jgi:acyl-CoA thioesterase FadM
MDCGKEYFKTGDLLEWAESRSMARASDPDTSKQAAADVVIVLSRLECDFMEALKTLGVATGNEVAKEVAGDNFARRNTIRRRASDLIAKMQIEQLEPRVCSVTGKRATVYRIRGGAS